MRHRLIARSTLAIAVLGLAAATPGAVAQTTAAPAGADDELALIRQGVAAREQGNDRKALDIFRLAYERFQTPRARAQMALAEQAMGLWAEAEADLDGALSKTEDAWIATNRQTLQQALAVIKQRVGTLEIMSNAPDTLVSVNGKPVGKLPLRRPLRVSAGTITVQVQAPGFAAAQRSVTVVAEQLARETFELVRLIVAPPAPVVPAGPEVLPFAPAPSAAAPEASFPIAAAPSQAPQDRAGGPSAGWPRAVFWSALAATAVATGLTVWSGMDVLRANDRYKLDPTKSRYDDGVGRQHRTNWLMGTTVVLGLSTAAIGLFSTDWQSR